MKTKRIIASFSLLVLAVLFTQKIQAQTVTANTNTDSLTVYRQAIDSLDREWIKILGLRMQVVRQIGAYKAKNNIPALQQSRFDALVQRNIGIAAPWHLSATLITEMMNAIHKESLVLEETGKKQ